MSKREDAGYIKRLSKVNKEVISWAKVPLVIMDKESDLSIKSQDLAEESMRQMVNEHNQEVPRMLMSDTNMPFTDFLFLNKTVKIADPGKYGTMEYNYYRVSISESGTFYVEYPTMHNGLSVMIIEDASGDSSRILFMENGEDHTYDRSARSTEIKRFMTAMLLTVVAFFKCLQESDLHPVETRGKQHRKAHAKKPWQRSDLVTIRFLNQMPRPKGEHKGGTHSSPRYHERKGTWRKMTNPRFKNHPKYGERIWIKSYWAGEKEAEVDGITYKVL